MLSEFQQGNIPFNGDLDYSTLYTLTQLSYSYSNFEINTRLERFDSPVPDRNYAELTQYSLRYSRDGLIVKWGNLYESIGSGILYRAYEIAGAVYEDVAFRSRYSFFRDLKGFSVNYSTDKWSIKALRGRPIQNTIPPDEDEEILRTDLVEAAEIGYSISNGHRITAMGLQNYVNDTTRIAYAGIGYSATLTDQIQFLGEWHNQIYSERNSFFDSNPQALYLSLNFTRARFGASLEWKYYDQFQLGNTGFNDPPALIREHNYAVLNRQTHILNSFGEKGFQVELYKRWRFKGKTTFNLTWLETFNGLESDYFEIFIEHEQRFGRQYKLKVFYDFAEDNPKLIPFRHSLGTNFSSRINRYWNTTAAIEYQWYRYDYENEMSTNGLFSFTLSQRKWFTASFIGEWSTDPLIIDRADTFEIEEDPRFWIGFSVGSLFSQTHALSLFAGQRRGGPACTSGICYEVQDFQGVELRYTFTF